MTIKKQIPSLSKLYTVYEEVPENFFHETDSDSFFYHIILDIAGSISELFKLPMVPTRKVLLSNYFSFATSKINKDSLLKRRCQVH